MNATEAVTVIRFLRMQLESIPQTDSAASTLQAVVDHLGMEVKRLTTPVVDDGGPAFPWGDVTNGGVMGGMTLRDYFAARWLEGRAAAADTHTTLDQVAEDAYRAADAMLKARSA